MNIFYTEDFVGNTATLHDAESKHCNLVLRKKAGDQIHLIDGKGMYAQGRISSQTKKTTTIEIESSEIFPAGLFKAIAICPTKNINRFEFFLEKATEIGINNIYPILCRHSERKILKAQRLEKILLSATKQSINFHLPTLHPLQTYSQFVEDIVRQDVEVFIAHYNKKNSDLFSVIGNENKQLVVIGPEGDFTEKEMEIADNNGFKQVNLGKSRLRTETAGIVASTFICA